MAKVESISRYNLIIKKLRKCPSSYNDISDYLKRESELQSFNFNTSLRTFQRDLNDIRSIYNIDIQYDPSNKAYYIVNKDDVPEVNERILESFDVFNALNVSDRISEYIHFEKRKPKGTENLYGLLHCIKNKLQVNFSYEKFSDDISAVRKTQPLALQEFKSRWYLIAKDLNDNTIKSFALDRLTDLIITKKILKYPTDFNIDEMFKYCFGIIVPDEQEPEEVLLAFDPLQGKYIKTLPLHHTQEIIEDNKKVFKVKLHLCITYDFIIELLSLGENVKVLKPKSLANDIKKAHKAAFSQY